MITWIKVQQTSVNDESATLCRWLVRDGQEVQPTDEIAEVETSKAMYVMPAGRAGYVRHLCIENEVVSIGAVIAAITDTPDQVLPAPPEVPKQVDVEPGRERRWTMKAELLANRHGIDISRIFGVGVIQEADVLAHLSGYLAEATGTSETNDLVDDFYGPRTQRLMVLGAGRGAVQVVDAIFRQREHRPVGLLDDDTSNHGKTLLGVPILGRLDEAVELHKQGGYDALIISFSNDQEARHRTYQRFSEAGIPFGNVIDPEATIHTNVMLGTGNVILANCRLGSCAAIGNNNFLSAYVNIEHHSVLGDSCTFGPGVMTSSRVVIGSHVRFGTGVFIEPGVMVGDRCVIASGSILTANVEADSAVKSMVQTVVRRIEQPRTTS